MRVVNSGATKPQENQQEMLWLYATGALSMGVSEEHVPCCAWPQITNSALASGARRPLAKSKMALIVDLGAQLELVSEGRKS